MHQKLAQIFCAAGFVVASVVFATSPAAASDSCIEGGKACLYMDAYYENRRNVVPIRLDYNFYPSHYWQGTYTDINDKVSSLQGHNVGVIRLFEHKGYGGDSRDFSAGHNPTNLEDHGFNDIASSHDWF